MLNLKFGTASADHEYALLEDMKQLLEADPEAQLFYIVPNHIKFESEINVLTRLSKMMGHEGRAIAVPRVQVFSLSRLAWYYMQDDALYQNANVSKDGLAMLVQRLLRDAKDELALYGNMLSKPGFISQFTDQLLEIKQANLSWDEVTALSEDDQTPETLQRKMHDLSLIGERLEDYLQKQGRYLNSDLLQALKLFLRTDKVDLSKHHFFINRYSQMTNGEAGVVESLITEAANVTLALPSDAGSASLREAQTDENDLFFKPKVLGRRFQYVAQDAGIETNVVGIDAQRQMSTTMHSVEDFWIHYEQTGVPTEAGIVQNDELLVWQSNTAYQEIEQMARQIRQEVATGDARYRDYLLMARDLNPYTNMIPAIFKRMGIPYFMDADKQMNTHPLVAFIKQLLGLERLTTRTIMQLLKNELLVPSEIEITEYREALAITENYVLAKNIQGWQWTSDDAWQYDWKAASVDNESAQAKLSFRNHQLALIHEQVSQVIVPFLETMKNAQNTEMMVRHLYRFLTENGVSDRLLGWRDEAIEQGDLFRGQQPEQVWQTLMNLLDDFVDIFGNEKMSISDLRETLVAGFDSATYTGIPATMDQVRITESGIVQGQNYKTAIIFGATAQQLPATTRTKAILNDGDRETLLPLLPESAKLRDTADKQMAEESLLMYNAMMSTTNRLIWSYPTSDGDSGLSASSYIVRLQAHYKNLAVKAFAALPDPTSDDVAQFVGSPATTLAHVIRMAQMAQLNKLPVSAAWQSVQQQVSQLEPKMTMNLMKSLSYHNQVSALSMNLVDAIFGRDLKLSVSRLQTYARNPYEFFLSYGLKLKERQVLQLTPADKGTFIHAGFEHFFMTLIQQNQVLGELSDAEIKTRVADSMHTILNGDDASLEIFKSSAQMTYLTEQMINQVANTILKMKRGQPTNHRVQTIGVETTFGLGEDGLPPVKYTLDNGNLTLRGKIDRMDIMKSGDQEFVTVVDYKSSARDFKLNKVIAGLELQLMTYWAALSQNSETPVGGALYWNAQAPWIKATDLSTTDNWAELVTASESVQTTNAKYAGVLTKDDAYLETLEPQEGQPSLYGFSRTKTGAISKTGNNTYDEDELDILTTFNDYQIRRIGNEILTGNFALTPFKEGNESTGLTNSPYKPVMMFDAAIGNQYNDISAFPTKRADALQFMQEEMEEEE
ncbi:PD-(D/E)XK nuclease family protein [Weissella ceti]|uniref:PD-(D/E)XK nuclease family protein n=1 Tax=Weissella ceti TaxID=759620 RepID=A0ABT3E5K4_9LACO|nr:PD-(D/E)XK nuclease family protein [Weissella ceti]MCW0953696.1 PD-(D/E)XK nuclease family protein [Weissella ceti]QVK12144.1 PD-(D/E)XK nuclease family protein [Weissella ceti]